MIPERSRPALAALRGAAGLESSGEVILAIDGTGLLVRCSRAAAPRALRGPDGTPTGTLAMFAGSLCRKLRVVRPEHVIVAWDAPDALDWRRSRYGPYKANRSPAPHDGLEMSQAMRLCSLIGVRQLSLPGFEADDVIAGLWRAAREVMPREAFLVCSDDADMLQLLSDGVTVATGLVTDAPITPAEAEGAWGVPLRLLSACRALCGDPSDNIPGIYGVGKAKAAKILHEGGLEWPVPLSVLGPHLLPGNEGIRQARMLDAWREIMELVSPVRSADVGEAELRLARRGSADVAELSSYLAFHGLNALLSQAERGVLL